MATLRSLQRRARHAAIVDVAWAAGPVTEAQALRSTREAYRRHQQTTGPFIPWCPRNVEP